MDIGLVTAFIGGVLALLSPCAALLLPAFFASTIGTGPRLWLHGIVFYAGLLVLLVPLGMGAAAVGRLFTTYRSEIVIGASVLLIVLGLLQALGFGFDPSRLLPGADSISSRARSSSGLVKTFLLGAASGIAGFCAGPILGAVLTIGAARGDVVGGGVLMVAYAAGMVVPLMVLALAWSRIGERTNRLLRGRTFTVAGREFHTTSVITGVLIMAVGVLFWATNGLVGVPELLPTDLTYWLQSNLGFLSDPLFDVLAILAVAVVVLVVWTRLRSRRADRDRVGSD